MEDEMEQFFKELAQEYEDENGKKEMKHSMECFLEALTSDSEKVLAMGESILKLCTLERFTPFELASMSATLIVSACRSRAENLGIESTNEFLEHMMNSIKMSWEDVTKEMEDDKCKDEDCNCKC